MAFKLSRPLHWTLLLLLIPTIALLYPYLFPNPPPYEAPLEGGLGMGVVPNAYIVELQLGFTFQEHEAHILQDLSPFVKEMHDPMWWSNSEGEIHHRGVRYTCKDVDDGLLALIRSDLAVKIVFIQSRHV